MNHLGKIKCPVTGEPFNGCAWSDHDKPGVYNTCERCCAPDDPMRDGVGVALARLAERREAEEWETG